MKPFDLTAVHPLALALLGAGLASAASAQPPTPSTVDLANFTTIASSANPALGQDGGFTDATGTAGANPGWTLFRYGTAGSSSGRLRITATSTSAATETYWTATPTASNTSAPPLHFSTATTASWVIITPKPGSTSPLQVTDSDGSSTFLLLTDQSQLGAYNTRLNQVLLFDVTHWYDPGTGQPIAPSVGTFTYGFTDFDQTLGYRSIQLTFTPAPEPATILAWAAAGLGLVALRRRRAAARTGRPAP